MNTPWWHHKQLAGHNTLESVALLLILFPVCSMQCYSLCELVQWLQKDPQISKQGIAGMQACGTDDSTNTWKNYEV